MRTFRLSEQNLFFCSGWERIEFDIGTDGWIIREKSLHFHLTQSGLPVGHNTSPNMAFDSLMLGGVLKLRKKWALTRTIHLSGYRQVDSCCSLSCLQHQL